jgi:hypothetical protein
MRMVWIGGLVQSTVRVKPAAKGARRPESRDGRGDHDRPPGRRASICGPGRWRTQRQRFLLCRRRGAAWPRRSRRTGALAPMGGYARIAGPAGRCESGGGVLGLRRVVLWSLCGIGRARAGCGLLLLLCNRSASSRLASRSHRSRAIRSAGMGPSARSRYSGGSSSKRRRCCSRRARCCRGASPAAWASGEVSPAAARTAALDVASGMVVEGLARCR